MALRPLLPGGSGDLDLLTDTRQREQVIRYSALTSDCPVKVVQQTDRQMNMGVSQTLRSDLYCPVEVVTLTY